MDGNGCSIGTHILSYKPKGLEPSVSKPLLMTLPASWFFASIVRCACDIGLAYVIKKA